MGVHYSIRRGSGGVELVELKRGIRALAEAMWEEIGVIRDFPYWPGTTAQPSDNPRADLPVGVGRL